MFALRESRSFEMASPPMDARWKSEKASVSRMSAVVDFSAFCQEMGRLYSLEFGSCDWDIHDKLNGCAVSFWNDEGAVFRFTGPDIETVLDIVRVEARSYFEGPSLGD